MRTQTLPLLIAILGLALPATASAAFEHVVSPGESLTSVAAADGLSVAQLAAANGISATSGLVAGTLLAIPPQEASATGVASSSGAETSEASADGDQAAVTSTPSTTGGYLVQPGDSLSGIAARYGISLDALAADNGLSPDGLLLYGTTLSIPGTSSAAPATTQYVSTTTSSVPVVPAAGPGGAQPTPEYVSPSEVGSIAAANGVPSSLAEAIGYQESGFNNDLVSPTGATGVMQIEPGTWDYIGANLASPPPLSPSSAADNVRAGVLLLHSLLSETGGNQALAAAGYYQGLASVQANGEYNDTQQYVNDVMALASRF